MNLEDIWSFPFYNYDDWSSFYKNEKDGMWMATMYQSSIPALEPISAPSNSSALADTAEKVDTLNPNCWTLPMIQNGITHSHPSGMPYSYPDIYQVNAFLKDKGKFRLSEVCFLLKISKEAKEAFCNYMRDNKLYFDYNLIGRDGYFSYKGEIPECLRYLSSRKRKRTFESQASNCQLEKKERLENL